MTDLRLESTDGEWLYLAGADGQAYRLLIDENLRKSVRREAFSANDAALISPRDIQLEVRSGISIEELAQKTGASLAYIEKFAAPVVDELAHIVRSALSVRITMAGDRYSETTQVEFGEVIANRLANQGVVQPVWSARKSDAGAWLVSCKFNGQVAVWAFDPRKLAISPENETAIALGFTQNSPATPVPKLRSVFESPAAPATSAKATVDQVLESAATENSANLTRDLGKTAEFSGVVPLGRNTTDVQTAATDENLATTADLLDALRKRRLEREQEALDQIPAATAPVQIVEPALAIEVDEIDVEPEVTRAEPERPKPRTGRSSMPSWDEIVFNSRSED